MVVSMKYILFTIAIVFIVSSSFASDASDAKELLDRFRSIDWGKREVGRDKDLSDDAWEVRIEVENELIALGESAAATLIEACADTDQHVRLLAAYVLGNLNHSPAAPALMKIAESDSYAPARLMAIEALGRLGASDALGIVQAATEDNNGYIRTAAKWALPRVEKAEGVGDKLRKLSLSTYDKSKIASAVVGKPAPDFVLMNDSGETVKLSDFRGKKNVVMLFLLADWWPVCNRELVQFQEVFQQFTDRNTEILVIDPQEVFRVASIRKKFESPFQFLADPTAWVSAQYGAAKQIVVHDEWVNVPAAFVIDKNGVLKYAHIGRGWPMSERAQPDDLLKNIPME